jgi:3'-5' exoribonuclease
MHHVYLGGLLEHSLAVAGLANDVSQRYPDLNRDLLVVGALLHDVGKVAELRYQRSFEYTDAGKLLGHIVIGVELVEEKLRTLQNFPQELAIHLKHLLLSHHGQYEYGSPKRPKTLEAVILNFLDDLDSKINGVRTHINREPDRDSSWTQYHRLYDRYFFKGTSAKPVSETDINKSVEMKSELVAPVERERSGQPRARFSNTLEEQLKRKKLGLFETGKQDNNDD